MKQIINLTEDEVGRKAFQVEYALEIMVLKIFGKRVMASAIN